MTRLQVNLYTIRGQLESGIDVCLEFLRQVGIDWCAHPTNRAVDEERHRLRTLAKQLSDEQLHALPPMSDPDRRATMGVFADLVTPALLTDVNLCHIVIMAAARLTLQHGICEEACYPLSCVFSVFNLRYADAELGFRLAQFAVHLANRSPQLKWSGRTFLTFGYFVTPWVLPIRSGLPFVRRGLEVALATGDLTWLAYAHRALIAMRLFIGEPLRELCEDAEQWLAFAEASGFKMVAVALAAPRDLALSLMAHDRENGSGGARSDRASSVGRQVAAKCRHFWCCATPA